jgi:ABC-type polysaccharide/polyol phosphate transport system ATPase subunit
MIKNSQMETTSIRVTSLGIKFFLSRGDETKESILGSLFSKSRKKEFWALRDVSFETKRGEILGIMGSNGAGKSTLLKIIAGIFPATEGKVESEGTIAPLIELGAAFNPELTGAENIYLTGSIYRVPRAVIRENFDRIVDFSGLRKFIFTPVKNYSSGMFIRLAFSTIIFFKPDIVLIDEVFSVGDEVFQQKSFEKILSFRKEGATIVLVTHDSNLIKQMCDRALVMSEGKVSFLGEVEQGVDHYRRMIQEGEGLESDSRLPEPETHEPESRRWGNKQVELVAVSFVDEGGEEKKLFQTGDYFEAQIRYVSRLKDETPVFGVAISTIYKLLIYGPNTLETEFPFKIPEQGTLRFIIPSLPLLEGDYLFSAAAYDRLLQTAYDHQDMAYHFRVVRAGGREFGSVRIQSRWAVQGD